MFFFHPRWPVFYEDNHVLVLYKPAGLIMQRGPKGKINFVDLARVWLKDRHGKPGNVFVGMVHRLDAPVAGVMVLPKTSKAASRLSSQFRENQVVKTYLAVVEGRPESQSGALTHHLVRRGRLSIVVPGGTPGSQEARLSYRVFETRGKRSLLEVNLETGRRHQIRAQLASAGLPVAGDVSYGAPRPMRDGRIALLARELACRHPTRVEPLRFSTPLPKGWPWPARSRESGRPLWTLEDFEREGLTLRHHG